MSFLKSKVLIILEISLIGLGTVGLVQLVQKKEGIETEIAALAKERDREFVKQEQLSEREKNMANDSYVELEAKRTLGYRKEGETVVVFYENEPKLTEERSEKAREGSFANPVQWLRYFFSNP